MSGMNVNNRISMLGEKFTSDQRIYELIEPTLRPITTDSPQAYTTII